MANFSSNPLANSAKLSTMSVGCQSFTPQSMRLNGQFAILQKLAFAVQYDFGFTYLDRCGRTINTILRNHPEWMIKGDNPNPQSGSMVSIQNGCSFSFSPYSFNFGLEMPTGGDHPLDENDIADFTDQVDFISDIVIDSLSLNTFRRIGVRAWYIFSFDNAKDAAAWLTSLDYYSISSEVTDRFGSSLEALSIVLVLAGLERKYRISLSSVERQAQLDLGEEILNVRASKLSKDQDKFLLKQLETKRRVHSNPEFAALLDVDVYQEDPVSIDPRDFIQTSIQDYSSKLQG